MAAAQQAAQAKRNAEVQKKAAIRQAAQAKKDAAAKKKADVAQAKRVTRTTQDISAYTEGYRQALPSVVDIENQYRPQFGAANIADIGQYQQGLQALQETAAGTAQKQLQDAQRASISGMTDLAGGARGLLQTISPEGASLVGQSMAGAQSAQQYANQFGQEAQQAYKQYAPDTSRLDTSGITGLASRAYQNADYLSPEQMRGAQQAAREAGMASGRVGGSSTIAAEILNREAAKAARRQEAVSIGAQAFQQQGSAMEQQRAAQAQGFGQFSSIGQQTLQAQEAARMANQQAYGQQQSFYTQPAFGLLGSTPQSYTAGQQFTQYGIGLLGQSTPQMINPDTGVNLGAAERQDANNLAMANKQAAASKSAGMMGGIGSAIGGIATAKAFMLCIPSGEMIDTVDGQKLINDIAPNDKIIGFSGDEVVVLQKHSYGENPKVERFVKIKFDDASSISLCDKHKVNHTESQNVKVGDCINKKTVVSIDYFGGVEISYDLLTSDSGYQMNGIPVNSMIPDLIEKIIEIKNEQ